MSAPEITAETLEETDIDFDKLLQHLWPGQWEVFVGAEADDKVTAFFVDKAAGKAAVVTLHEKVLIEIVTSALEVDAKAEAIEMETDADVEAALEADAAPTGEQFLCELSGFHDEPDLQAFLREAPTSAPAMVA
jgi:hypothetical protein